MDLEWQIILECIVLPYKKRNSDYKRYNNFQIQIPRGYDARDAGRGALLDGSIANADPKRSPIFISRCNIYYSVLQV